MKSDQTFDFHGMVGLRIETENRFAADYFRAEYETASGSTSVGLPEVVLRWTESSLPFRPGADYRLKIHKGLARWFYRIRFEPETILIEATGNQMAVPMVHHMLVHGCLRYLCSRQDTLLIHAAAVAHEGRSLIFAGSGGVGKTTVSSVILDQGGSNWELHADDYVFLTSKGDTYSYPSRAHLYLNLLREVPGAAGPLGRRQLAHLRVFGLVRQLSGERIKWPLRVEPSLLWPDRDTAAHASLQALLLLDRHEDKEIRLKPIEDLERLVDQLLEVNFKEARHTVELFAGFEPPLGYLEQWEARERETLRRALQNAPVYRLWLPQTTPLNRNSLVSELQQLVTVEDDGRVND